MPDPLISVIDDDESTLLALAGLLRSFGFETRTYGSAEAFIQAGCCGGAPLHHHRHPDAGP